MCSAVTYIGEVSSSDRDRLGGRSGTGWKSRQRAFENKKGRSGLPQLNLNLVNADTAMSAKGLPAACGDGSAGTKATRSSSRPLTPAIICRWPLIC